MKIQLIGIDHHAVTSAYASVVDGDHLSILINTRDRYVDFHRVGASLDYIADYQQAHGQDAKVPEHDCVQIFSNNDASDPGSVVCEVVFIAENDAEIKLLRGACYISQEKDQIELLKINREMKLDAETIAEFRHLPKPKP
ncbi:hypothetical protein ACKF11_12810 [Methylobacillus sp. Pita2]|uniref:hypothetical protein n=1 Tax=Methylobacillus sp. Pita2 TaxID=3383245 RepID=UPI0038B61F39